MPLELADWRPLGRALRLQYIAYKTALLRQTYKLPVRYDALAQWEGAARLCHELELDAEAFIRSLFDKWPSQGGPFPNAMAGATARRLLSARPPPRITTPPLPPPPSGRQISDEDTDIVISNIAPYDVDTDLMYVLKQQWAALKERAGTTVAATPEALKVLRDFTEPLAPWFRIMVAYNDEIVWQEFSHPGLQTLRAHPPLVALLNRAWLPVVTVMAKTPAPAPAWARYNTTPTTHARRTH